MSKLDELIKATKPPAKRSVAKLPKIDKEELAKTTELMNAEMRGLFVQSLVTAFLDPVNEMNMTKAYAAARPNHGMTVGSLGVMACKEFMEQDVRAEMVRQIGVIKQKLELDEEWVYRQWESMANSNIFDYMEFNEKGTVSRFKLDPNSLSREQQLNIRQIKFDKNGAIASIKLSNREDTIANIAKALKMFRDQENLATDLAAFVTELMQKASKRHRTFDAATGEEIE